jgi:hypothetical protein
VELDQGITELATDREKTDREKTDPRETEHEKQKGRDDPSPGRNARRRAPRFLHSILKKVCIMVA